MVSATFSSSFTSPLLTSTTQRAYPLASSSLTTSLKWVLTVLFVGECSTMETQTAPTFGRCPVEASCISYASRAEKSVRKLHDLPAAGVPNALMRRASCNRRFRVCHHARARCRM